MLYFKDVGDVSYARWVRYREGYVLDRQWKELALYEMC